MTRRKTVYPQAKTSNRPGMPSADTRSGPASRVVTIEPALSLDGHDLVRGQRIEIRSGLYAGETAVVESVAGGVIPAVVVRTEAGRTRRMRVIDLMPLPGRSEDGTPKPG